VTKGEFIEQVASKSGQSKKDAAQAVEAMLDVIRETLRGGGDVSFTGFGKFHVRSALLAPASTPAPARRCRSRRAAYRSSPQARS
jgi:DNA-binding protein HU-beta